MKDMGYLRINLTIYVQDFYAENYKDQNKQRERYDTIIDRKIQQF